MSYRSSLKLNINRFFLGEESRKGIITVIDQVVVSATNFFTGVIIGRTLPKEQFGYYMLGLTIVFLAINLQNSLISWPYTIYRKSYKNIQQNIYIGSTLIHLLFLNCIVLILILLVGYFVSLGVGQEGLEPIIWALLLAITFIMLREFARRLFFANMRMHSALILDLIVAIFQIGGLIIFAYNGALSASRSYWIIGGACGLVSVTWLAWNHNSFPFSIRYAWLHLKRNFSFGKWIFAGSTVFTASSQLCPWLLASFHGAAATGTLAAYLGILGLSNPFHQAMTHFLLPMTADVYSVGGIRGLRRVVLKAVIVIGMIMGLFCLIMLLFGNQIVIFVYGRKYANSSIVLVLMALSVAVAVVTYPFGYALYTLDRPEISFKCDLIGSVIIASLAILMIKALGLLGVGIGLLAGNLGASAIRYLFYRKNIQEGQIGHRIVDVNTISRDTL